MKDLYNTINKVINNKSLNSEEATNLVHIYITEELGKEPTSEELTEVLKLLQRGIFDFEYMLDIILKKPHVYGLYTCSIYSSLDESGNRKFIKRTLYRNQNGDLY